MERVNVTKTFLPPQEEYQAYLDQIWADGQLTNQGPLLREFENKVEKYLDIPKMHFVSNGTTALQIALHALAITEGEVITTPFTYVATTSSILWERCQPVFVDIEPDTFCIDADKIEAAITPQTRAIMAVHVFGYPCDIAKIDAIAKKHGLKVIYDAAHTFGAQYKGKSLLNYGDISIGSFHSTKVFHTIEGGCLVARDSKVSERIELIKRFGHTGDEHFMLGINAKASEFQAAMGLCNLKYIDGLIAERKKLTELYDSLLKGSLHRPMPLIKDFVYNYAYLPVVLDSEAQLLKVKQQMEAQNIHPRRYFYPSINTLSYVEPDKQSCPVSEDISLRILCLPLYPGLDEAVVRRVCQILQS